MGRVYSKAVTADTTVVTTAETVAIVSDPISQSYDQERVTISGMISMLTGTGTTALTIRVREGNGITGTQVGESIPVTIGAGANDPRPFQVSYNPQSVANMPYSVTVQQTAASANGTVLNASVTVFSGSS